MVYFSPKNLNTILTIKGFSRLLLMLLVWTLLCPSATAQVDDKKKDCNVNPIFAYIDLDKKLELHFYPERKCDDCLVSIYQSGCNVVLKEVRDFKEGQMEKINFSQKSYECKNGAKATITIENKNCNYEKDIAIRCEKLKIKELNSPVAKPGTPKNIIPKIIYQRFDPDDDTNYYIWWNAFNPSKRYWWLALFVGLYFLSRILLIGSDYYLRLPNKKKSINT
jgi:hypothetical protein